MFGTSRAITPLLATQALTLLVTTGAAVAWTVQEVNDWHTDIAVPQATVRTIESHIQKAIVAPYDYLGTGSLDAQTTAQRSIAEARASLRILGNMLPGLNQDVGNAISALQTLESASQRLWDGHASVEAQALTENPVEALEPDNSLDLLQDATDEVNGTMAVVTAGVSGHIGRKQLSGRVGLLCMWAGAIGVYIVTGWAARRRFIRHDTESKTALTAALDGVGEALVAANEGKPVPSIPDHPLVRHFTSTIDDVAFRLDDLHKTNRRIRRQFTFRHELVDALDLAETETDVVMTASRAARVAFPDKQFQMLIGAPDEDTVTPIDEATPVACTMRNTESCPAIRKGCTLFHHPDMGLSRCPRIRDESTIVTCSPITVNGAAVGVVQLMGDALDDGQEELLEALSTTMGARTGIVRNLAERELAAGTDALTGLANRRAMDEHLRRLDGAQVPYTIIVADLDHFKKINDTHGHDIGDQCLQLFAEILKEACRDTDIACRPGGEEFSLILYGAGIDAGMAVASRIRAMLAQETRRQGPIFTASLGIAGRPQHGDSAEEVMRSADVALYDAKDQGRDQCVAAVPMSLEVVG